MIIIYNINEQILLSNKISIKKSSPFTSYKMCVYLPSKKDSIEARSVADYLEGAGIDVYFDEYDGDLKIHNQSDDPKEVTKSILTGINNSSHMIVIVSPNTILSAWVPFEIG